MLRWTVLVTLVFWVMRFSVLVLADVSDTPPVSPPRLRGGQFGKFKSPPEYGEGLFFFSSLKSSLSFPSFCSCHSFFPTSTNS